MTTTDFKKFKIVIVDKDDDPNYPDEACTLPRTIVKSQERSGCDELNEENLEKLNKLNQ